MSGEREIKRRMPGFGKRGSARVKLAERKPSSMGHLTQICRRWWGKKELQGKMAKKGLASSGRGWRYEAGAAEAIDARERR
jgi:hypothetical protein